MKILLLLLLCLPIFATAQIDTLVEKRLKGAATDMIGFDKQFRTGLMVELLGGIVIGVSQIKNEAIHNTQPFLIVGGILAFAGFIINASSSSHIKDAAIKLQGGSLVIPIRKKPVTIFKN